MEEWFVISGPEGWTAIMHPLEFPNLQCAAAIPNNSFIELLTPECLFDFGLTEPIVVQDGVAILPDRPGFGIDFDWDLIENCTTSIHR